MVANKIKSNSTFKPIKQMTQKEFEERTGLKTSAEEYAEIERMYMAAGSMDKDLFCRCWRQTAKNPLTQELFKQVETLEAQLDKFKKKLEDMRNGKSDLLEFLIGKSRAYNDTDFRTEAVRLAGEMATVMKTLEMDLPLWEEDKKFVKSYLGNVTDGREAK